MAITEFQLDALGRHSDGKNWNLVPIADKALIHDDLWETVKACGNSLATDLPLATEVQTHTSHPTPNGRAPRDLWACVFPLGSANKSYAFQLFFIVSPDGVEFGFAAGAGEAQISDSATTGSAERQFAAARGRLLAAGRDQQWVGREEARLRSAEFHFLKTWRAKTNAAREFRSLAEWLGYAGSAEGAGASISGFISRDAVIGLGDRFCEEVKARLASLASIYERAHPKRTKEEIARAITDGAGLPPVTFSTGSTEPKELFSGVIDALGLTVDKNLTKVQLAETIATLGGQPWDATCHSRGGTVTHEGLERVLASVAVLAAAKGGTAGEPGGTSLMALEDELCVSRGYLQDIDWLMRDKLQIVFFGPPGTGKTFVARRYAEWLAGSAERVELIQFHASYAYEDFLEGIRPVLAAEEGGLRYELAPGVLLRLLKRMKESGGSEPWVLVIDEINRANLSRVFGELLYLLEYRQDDKGVRLQYSGDKLTLPENLYIIGTMNTADRSIALVDFALRPRFHFVSFPADTAILTRWLAKHGQAQFAYVADMLRQVNKEIGKTDFAVGFSYFMRQDLSLELIHRIWRHSVVPTLEEYFVGEREAEEFSLDAIAKRARTADGIPAGAEEPATLDEPSADSISTGG